MTIRDWHGGQLGLLWSGWLLLFPLLWFTAPYERELLVSRSAESYQRQAAAQVNEGTTLVCGQIILQDLLFRCKERIDSLASVLASRDKRTVGDYFRSFYDQQFVILLWGALGVPLFMVTWRWFDYRRRS